MAQHWLRAMAVVAVAMVLAARAAAAAPLACRCADEAAQLFEIDVELRSAATGAPLALPAAGAGAARKICRRYPLSEVPFATGKFPAAWHGFDDVATVQLVLPAALATRVGGVVVRARTVRAFHGYHQAAHLHTSNGSLAVPYPPAGAGRGISDCHPSEGRAENK